MAIGIDLNVQTDGINQSLFELMQKYENQIINPVSIQCHSAHNNGTTHTNQTGHWSDSHTDYYTE